MPVWHLQAWQVDNHIVNSHDVDINNPVHIVPVGIAVAVAVIEFMLNVVNDVQSLDGCVVAFNSNAHVEETVVTLKAPWLAFDDG